MTKTKTAAEEYAEIIIDELRELTTQEDIDIFLTETILDFQVFRSERGNCIVQILRTCGGPHCEITWSTESVNYVTVNVRSGSDTFTKDIYVPVIGESIDAIIDVER